MNNNLKKYRNSLGMKSKEIAVYLNMSESAYCYLENGITKLDIDRAEKLSQLYNIKIDELVKPKIQIIDIEEKFYITKIVEIKKELSYIKDLLKQINNKINI